MRNFLLSLAETAEEHPYVIFGGIFVLGLATGFGVTTAL